MKTKAIKKSTKLTLAIVALLIMLSIALVFFLTRRNAEVESERLDTLQQNMLEELSARRGDYNENKIVLSGTSHSKAEQLAEVIGANLRITADGSFATLTLTDGRTIADIIANNEYKSYLDAFGIDYVANVSDFYVADEDSSYRNPSMPSGGYASEDELGDYLGFMNIGDVWHYYKGNGVTVAVIDTGIDTDHPEFTGRISEYSYNATEDKIVKDYVLENGEYDWSLVEDVQGHGTAVAGALGASMDGIGMTGVAPNVTIIVIKAECDEKGRFKSTSDLVFGLYYAIERDVNVVNMSFGSDSNPFAEATQLAYDSDVICVAAAGNDNTAQLTYPAADPNVIGVGALADGSWELASYSNYGENTDVVAPGTVYTAKNGGGYATMNGTSFASPLVAGMISLFMQNNRYTTFDNVCDVLYASSYDLGQLGFDWIYGYGAVDVNAFILEERGTLTYDMMTDELEDQDGLFIRNHTIQNMLEPERLYAVFDGWYYDPHYVEEFVYYEDRVVSDITLYAKWVSEDDEIPFTYRELDDGTIEITSYRGRRRFISVPEYIDGKLVTSIGANAFAGETRLREVNLPFGINNIGTGAFYGCTNLTRIDIPENVIKIDNYAFYSCVRLAYINFGQHPEITYIGDEAFAYCSSLISFNVPANVTYLNGSAFFGATAIRTFTVDQNNISYVADGGVLFNATKSTLVAYPAGVTSSYSVPEGVSTIGVCAFGYTRADTITLGSVTSIQNSAFSYSGLTSIVIPDTVISVGKGAFAYSAYLSEAKLSASMKMIENDTFYQTGLISIEIHKSIVQIGGSAFEKSALSKVTFEEESQLRSIGISAFAYCCLQNVDLPASLVTIDSNAFWGNSYLEEVTFSDDSNLRTIGASAFVNTISLAHIAFPESLEALGDFAFGNSALTGIIGIPEKLSYFGEGAFASCYNLTEFSVDEANPHYNSIDGVVYSEDGATLLAYPAGKTNYSYRILDGTKKIGGAAFYGAKYVTNVQFNSELEEIDDYAFSHATSLNAPTMPIGLMKIGRFAFEYTDNLYTVYFDSEAVIPHLSYESFAYSGLQYLTIPKNVSTMSQGVFKGCDRLYSITFAENSKLESISAFMFDGCSNLQQISFGAGSSLTSVQAHGLEGMSSLQSIDFGDAKITNIDNFAFRFCANLTSVNLPDTVTNIGRYAFYYCKSLSEISIPTNVEHIGSYAFLGTNNCEIFFENEILPAYLDEDWDRGIKGYYLGTLDVVDNGDFTYAVLSSGNIAILKYNGNDEYVDLNTLGLGNIIAIGGQAFAFKNVKSIILPEGLITIQAEAFFGSHLEEIHIPSSVEFIGREAFYNTPITSLTFGDDSKLAVIEQSAFENTKSLSSVILPESLTKIGTAAFRRSALTSVIFADGIDITEIAVECFAFSGLTSVSIPDSVVKIGDGAFRNCTSLESFDYGEQKLWLGANAFYDSGLKSFYVSKNLYVIEEFALASLNECESFVVDEANEYYKGVNGLILLENGRKLVVVPAGMQGCLIIPESVESIGFGSFEASELSEVIFSENGNILCIANRAFFGAENLTEIVIPDSVISIDYYAFAYATNLQKVTFAGESRLTGIYEGAFYGCSSLSDILLPDSLVEISDFAFYGCRKLTALPISENTTLKGIYSYAFAYTGLADLVVPEDVVDIGDYSFLGTNLKSVVISNKKELQLRIGIGAFEDCKELEYIELPFIGASYEDFEISWFGYIFGAGGYAANQTYIPECLKNVKINGSITFVGNYAFYGVTSVDSLDLPDTINTLYYGAFYESTIMYEINSPLRIRTNHYLASNSLSYYFIGKGIKGDIALSSYIKDIQSQAFRNCTKITSITIPNSIIGIDWYAFDGCTSLKSVYITDIEKWCNISFSDFANPLYYAGNLYLNNELVTNLIIPNNITSIGVYAFYGCTSLTSITIPSSVTSIGVYAFRDCYNLTSINVPNSVTTIGSGAFLRCKSLTSVNIPDGITNLYAYTFEDCTSLTHITIPDSVISIDERVFHGCTNLASISIPNGVSSIGDRVFYNCASLKSVTIPNTVANIGEYAFNGCTNLTSVTIPDNDIRIGEYAFGSCYSLKVVTNNSDLPITLDNYADYGYITKYAKLLIDKNGNKYYKAGTTQVIDTTDGFRFIVEYNEYKLIAYTGNEDTVTLPLDINGNEYIIYQMSGVKNVIIPDGITNIGNSAFSGCTSLTSVTIPDSVTSIGSSAFSGCENLKSVTIPDSVTTIDHSAFRSCTSLTSVTIPDSITSISAWTFYDCTSLTSVTIPDSVTNINFEAFYGCTSLASIPLPNSVTSIGDSAFQGCVALDEFEITENVSYIGSGCFAGCDVKVNVDINNDYYKEIDSIIYNKDITTIVFVPNTKLEIIIPNTVIDISGAFSGHQFIRKVTFESGSLIENIGWDAFRGCQSLTNVNIPNSVKSIGNSAFSGCTSLTSVTIPDSVTSIGDSAFRGCENLKSVTIPDSVTTIGDLAFCDCTSLTSVTIPNSVTSIGSSAFSGCENLKSVTIPDSVTTIGHSAFHSCTSLTSVTIPNSVTSIGSSAFSGCRSLTSVIIPNNVTSIGHSVFSGCRSLTSVIIPNSVTSIGDYAFQGCTGLTSVTIPDSVTSIGDYAFSWCENLRSVTIADGVTSIGREAFSYCYALESVTIPNSVTRIGEYAFYYCLKLESVMIPNSIASINAGTFYYCSRITHVIIPHNIDNIGEYAFYGCTNLTSVTIPDNDIRIGKYAFQSCYSLEVVTNNSDLPITLDNYADYGYITEYAKLLIDKNGNKYYKSGTTQVIDTADGFIFIVENNEYKLIAYAGNEDTVTLPLDINGNEYIIYQMRGVKNVIIPDGITSIGSNAFYNCISLESVTIPNSVTSIGDSAFSGCENLKSVTIPDSVTSLGTYAFMDCESLEKVFIGDGLIKISSYAFSSCVSLTDVTFGNSVTSIDYSAFVFCVSLTTFSIPDSVTNIGGSSFAYCTRLTSLTIPNSVTSIGPDAFRGCVSLKYIAIPNSVTHIGGNTFLDTGYMNDPDNWSSDGALYIGDHLIDVKQDTTKLYVPNRIISVADGAFSGCYQLKYLEIPKNVTGLNALTNLETLVIRELRDDCVIYSDLFSWNLPITLKNIVLLEDAWISEYTFANIAGVTIYVEGLEKDLRWDDNFPGWNNGNNVVYGDEWINVTFYDHLGTLISNNIFATHQVIRIPYLEVEGNAMYSYIVEGFDIDGDGIADTLPATSSVDITAVAIVKQVLNTYTVNFYDDENVLYSFKLPYGSLVTLPEDPSKLGYDFLGWEGYTEGMVAESDINIYSVWNHHGDGHAYGEAITVDPTCEGDGYDKYVCEICGEWYKDNVVSALGHNYSVSVVSPTCDSEGYTLHFCDCGHSYKDNFTEAAGHTYGKWKNTSNASCIADGSRERTCSVCSHKDVEIIPATGHSYKAKVIREATCEKEGSVRYTCNNCGSKITETIPVTAHNYEKQYASKSFLQWLIELLLDIFYGYEGDNGYYFKCKDCGHVATEDEVKLSASASVMGVCEHDLGDWVIVQSATCIDYEVLGRYCSLCNEIVEAKVGNIFTEHNPADAVVENRVEPDCTTDGKYDNVVYCSVCEAELSREIITIDKLGHKPNDTVVENRVEPDCITDGKYDSVVYCSVCGDELSRVIVEIDKLGHAPVDAVVENRVEPDCTTDGKYDSVVYCSVCNAELVRETVVIDKLGHNFDTEWTIDLVPTCTTVGSKSHHCLRCDEKSDITEIPANGHDYDEWFVVTLPTCTETGLNRRDCKVCGHYETEVVKANGHTSANAVVENRVEPDCTTDGKYDDVVYCSVCNAELSRETVVIDKLGHNFDTEWTVDVEPTCTTVGSKSHHCTRCDEKSDVTEIPANGHSFGEWYETKAPTCTATGIDEHKCSICGHTETKVTDALGHKPANAVVENRVEPDCTIDGKYDSVVYCSVCNAELRRETITIDKLGHNYSTEWTIDVEPTCTTVGSKSHHCTRCDKKSDVTEVPANGHSFGEWYETKAPTCTGTGIDEHKCSVCEHTETKVTDALGHNPDNAVVENRVEPNCTTDGKYDNVVYCSVCNTELSRETVVIDKLGHNYNTEWTIDLAPTCTTVGSKSHHCLRCDKKSDVTEIPVQHNFTIYISDKNATYTKDGTKTARCNLCDVTDTIVDEGSALGLTKKFRDELALINDTDSYETAYVKMRAALITYQSLSDNEKSEVNAEYQILADRIISYNNTINEANTEHSSATELAFAPLATMSFTFMAALWYLLKKKIFG